MGRGSEALRIRRLFDSGPNACVLDVGGGTGAFTSKFGSDAKEVVVLEPGSRDVVAGRGRHPSFQFVQGIGESIPFRPEAFDLVTAIRSTHHMHAPEKFFQEAQRVLKDEGRILIEERAKAPPLAGLLSLFSGGHSHHLDTRQPEDWVRALTEAGFDGARVEPVSSWFLVSGVKRSRGERPPEPTPVGR